MYQIIYWILVATATVATITFMIANGDLDIWFFYLIIWMTKMSGLTLAYFYFVYPHDK